MRKFLILLVMVVLAVVAGPVASQGLDEVQVVSQTTQIDQAGDVLFKAIWTIVLIPAAAPLVQILTNLLKTAPFLAQFGSKLIAFTLTVLTWVGFQIMNEAGYGGYFDSVVDIVTTMAMLLLAVFGTQVTSGQLYDLAREQGIPLLGYERGATADNFVSNAVPADHLQPEDVRG